MCFKHQTHRKPFWFACSRFPVWPLLQTPKDRRHLLWALPNPQATASFGPTIYPLVIQHIFWRFLWKAAPRNQGFKEKRFLLVSLLLLSLPILRTILYLIKHTSKLCRDNTFHLKCCSVIMKVNCDLFCAPTCVAHNRWLSGSTWLGTGKNEHCHLEKSLWLRRVSVLGILERQVGNKWWKT